MKILFVVNPISGGIDKGAFLKEAKEKCQYYGISYEIYKTTGKNDKAEILRKAKDTQLNKVIAVGGDGTLLTVGVALKDTGLPIGFVPMGSANGMAKELGIPEDPKKALNDILLSYKLDSLDLVVVNQEHYCMHIGDVGLNASTVNDYEKDESRGMLTYAKYFLKALKEQESFDFKVVIEGQEQSYSGVMLGICNGRKFGTGIPLNNISNPFDGVFELVIIKEVNSRTIVQSGLSFLTESFSENQTSVVLRAQEANITFTKPHLLQLDGEVIGEYSELSIKILPSAIPFITHGGNPYL